MPTNEEQEVTRERGDGSTLEATFEDYDTGFYFEPPVVQREGEAMESFVTRVERRVGEVLLDDEGPESSLLIRLEPSR